ncbi:MAG: GNAT family N-acetyltransferase [Candidatus Taylorbacteria bacterium]|nr:GNAT family N-acetyltransferase [Candidatus Taylorbacteria bacterium]
MLKPVTEADAQLLFQWRNDPETRANSINTEPVPWEKHLEWLRKSISDSDRRLFIFLQNGKPAGTCRIDRSVENGEEIHELSWTVAPEWRGKGIGKAMIGELLQEKILSGKKKKAVIKPNNIPSIKIVERHGFKRGASSGGLTTWYLM